MQMLLPTKQNLAAAQGIYEQLAGWKMAKKLIESFFCANPRNDEELTVAVKVLLINGLYYTNLKAPLSVVTHILRLSEIDNDLHRGATAAVDRIAQCEGKNLLSFASKYAHFQNEQAFPLYDQYAWKAFAYCCQRKPGAGPVSYQDFYVSIESFRKLAGLDETSWTDMDKYLWLLGIKKDLEKGSTKISKEVAKFQQTEQGSQLFHELEPLPVSVVLEDTNK